MRIKQVTGIGSSSLSASYAEIVSKHDVTMKIIDALFLQWYLNAILLLLMFCNLIFCDQCLNKTYFIFILYSVIKLRFASMTS